MHLHSSLRVLAGASLALVVCACAPDKDPLDTLTAGTAASNSGSASNGSGNSSNSGGGTESGSSASGTGGSATDGGTGGVTEGTSASSVSTTSVGTTGVEPGQPDPACLDLLACMGVVTPDQLPQAEQAYGPDSPCWSGDPQIAEQCAQGCQQSLDSLGQQYPDVRECGGGGGPGTTTDPGTTGPSGDWGNCGWDGQNSYYACLGMPGEPDPDGINPIDCPPDLPQSGAACDANSPITDIGCCTPSGDNYYCGQSGIVIEPCGP